MAYYSKNIIDHFLHPKHLGRIDHADGVGDTTNLRCGDVMKVYIKVAKRQGEEYIKDIKFETLGCLPPQEEILINEGGWEEIKNVGSGFCALNGDGRRTEVLRAFIREYKGDMLTITPFASLFNSFSVTPDHPILCIKREWLRSVRKASNRCDWSRVSLEELKKTTAEYVLARDIKKSDYLIFSFNKTVKDRSKFGLETMKLLGYYLAEGYGLNSSGVLYFSMGKEEHDNIKELKFLIKQITGKDPKERVRRTAIEVYVCSRKWTSFFKKHGGQYARHKRLAREIMLLPFEKQWEMVKTYLKGDGCVIRRRPQDSITYSGLSASKNLVVQLQEILARGGIFAYIIKRKESEARNSIEGRKVSAGPIYEFRFKLERKHNFIHYNNNYFLIPVRSVNSQKYEGKVYNILVDGTPNSYLVRGFVVHNCGHAIATSDMICELVKGKSLKQAARITYEDVAGQLGEMPPQKMHCAHLAETALKAAIKDYREKNRKK